MTLEEAAAAYRAASAEEAAADRAWRAARDEAERLRCLAVEADGRAQEAFEAAVRLLRGDGEPAGVPS